MPNMGGSIPQKKQLRGHKLLAQEKGTSNAPTPALSKKAAPNKGRHIHFSGKGPRFSCHWGAPPRDHPARRAARPPKAQWATNRNVPTPPRRAAIATSPKGRNIDRNSAATSIKGKLNSAAALFSLPLIEVAALFLSMFLPFGEVAIAALRGGVGTFLFVAHCALGGLAALRAGWSLGGAPQWHEKRGPFPEKWMCLPLFGAAFLLSAGVGALLVPFSWARSLWPLSCFFWGMLPPMLGIAAGSFAARRKSFH